MNKDFANKIQFYLRWPCAQLKVYSFYSFLLMGVVHTIDCGMGRVSRIAVVFLKNWDGLSWQYSWPHPI